MESHVYLDTPWWYYSAEFRMADDALSAWKYLNDTLAGKDLDLGVYRHGPSTDPGRFVTALSLQPQGVLRARRILRKLTAGREHRLPLAELEAMIARRIRFVANEVPKHRPGPGYAEIHHEGDGRALNPDGTYS